MPFDPCYVDPSEQPLDKLVPGGGNCAIFRTIACIGDSLSSGEMQSTKPDGTSGYHDYYEYSWGQFLARMIGAKVYNFSKGGMSAREYCANFAESNRYWSNEYASQAYIIALGVNDLFNLGHPFGSLDDIDLKNWRNNKDTFTGRYAEIIQRYHEIQPRAFFFLLTMPSTGEDDDRKAGREAHAKRLHELAALFPQTYVLDFNRYAPKYNKAFWDRYYLSHHMNPSGYLLTAQMTASYIDYIIRHDPAAFAEVAFIGTDLHG
ncbi:MAG: SGNH/GDSL hydrolase family protein [Clostridia bacterium]|nr:SGNH/GDSL hydrolase family protein [Clostridia bacterium]